MVSIGSDEGFYHFEVSWFLNFGDVLVKSYNKDWTGKGFRFLLNLLYLVFLESFKIEVLSISIASNI